MTKLRTEASVPPAAVEPPDAFDRFLTTGQELYARCPLHGLVQVFVGRYRSGREVVGCSRCQRVLIEWTTKPTLTY